MEKEFSGGWGRVLIRFRVAASRVPRREDVLQWYYENSASLLEKLRNLNIRTCNVPFKCYVREGFASKVSKITEKHFKAERVIH